MESMTLKSDLRNDKIRNSRIVFLAVLYVGITYTFLELLLNSENAFQLVFFSNHNAFFSDFFDSVYDSLASDPYAERGVIYPAFIYVFYRAIAAFLPVAVSSAGSYAIRDSYVGEMIFHAYCYALMIAIFTIIVKIMHSKDKITKLFAFALLLSTPVLYAYERGNSILVSLLFLLLFFYLKDSEKGYQREWALISLAVAANIKIYPAIFGLLLLAEKKYIKAFRCMIYGVILFVFPFFFFGGLKDIPLMFSNIFRTSSSFGGVYGYQVGIRHLLSYLSAVTGNPEILERTGMLTAFVAIILLFNFFFTKEYFKKVLMLGIMCNLIPGFSWLYTTVYILPAVIYYYIDGSDRKNHIYPICFVLLFCQFPIDISGILPTLKDNGIFVMRYNMTLSTVLSNIALWVLLIVSFAETVFECSSRYLSRRMKSKG